MSTHKMIQNGKVVGLITMANIYKYKGFIFEWHYFCGPMKLKKDWTEAKCAGAKFYRIAQEWNQLSKKEKELTRVSG